MPTLIHMPKLNIRTLITAVAAVASLSLIGLAVPLQAQEIVLDKGMTVDEPRSGWLPYAFATESLGTAAGLVGFAAGNLQPQTSLVGGGFATSNGSYAVAGAFNNYLLPKTERLFVDSFLMLGHYTDERFYVDLDQNPNQVKAGTNDSDQNDYVDGTSNNVLAELTLKYVLPIGNARDDVVAVFHLDEGLLDSGPVGGEVWNPLVSGRTTFSTKAFFHYRDLDNVGHPDQLSVNSNGLEFKLDYNNTDFLRNPARGSRQQIRITRDFGWFNSSTSWTNIEAELTKYFDVGSSDWFRQRVVALNFWTSNTPTWDPNRNNAQIVNHRPPPNMGSYLGGYDRMRAYPLGRFQDKSAVYYSAEMRLIPRLPSLREVPILEYFEIDWVQVVGFVEAGRVGEDYNGDLFYKNLKFDAGIDLRLMAFRNVFRVGYAVSDEDSSVWAMYNQTFGR